MTESIHALELLAGRRTSPRMGGLFERAVMIQRRSAAVLRRHRQESAAHRAELFADRLTLHLEWPAETRRMLRLVQALDDSSTSFVLLHRALHGAIELTGADFGNLQLVDPRTGALRIAAVHGFDAELLQPVAVVDDFRAVPRQAARKRMTIVIPDVLDDADFAPHHDIAAALQVRAVQSTPMIDPQDQLQGIISTHFRRAGGPTPVQLQLLAWYAEHAATVLAARLKESANAGASGLDGIDHGSRGAAAVRHARRVQAYALEQRRRATELTVQARALRQLYDELQRSDVWRME